MATRHDELTRAGARVVGIAVDDPGRNAAMVDKLRLPFPLLADPDGEGAIRPYGVWHDEPSLARPAIVVVDLDGAQAYRQVSRDFADRLHEDAVVERVRALELEPVTQDPPTPGDPRPGPRAFPAESLRVYFRGVRFAAIAMGSRVPEAAEEARMLRAEADRYLEARNWLKA